MGTRGEGWVLGQFVIGAAILAAPFVSRVELPFALRLFGVVLMLAGAGLIALGIIGLGKNLTPFPRPRDGDHALVTTGVYAIVRHPIYSGFAFGALGWSLWWGSVLGVLLSLVLLLWFDLKARREEQWLAERYPEYKTYQTRVRKLIPFLY
jgi:protein-S-isoprenylcysteine O-methyltransferase Ste14